MSGPPTRVLVVDWLGRGGIAQTSAAWARELRGVGTDVTVVTRPDRELSSDVPVPSVSAGGPVAAVLEHRRVAAAAAAAIREVRPACVVIQNFILPPLERRVHEAARAVGARTIVVVHDHRSHSRWSGTRIGLRRDLRSADLVLAHSSFVADHVARRTGRPVEVLDHPLPSLVLDDGRPEHVLGPCPRPTAISFGVLKRRYKGGDLMAELATQAPGWRCAVVGNGASASPGVVAFPGYVAGGTLARAVEESDVAVLPYRFATQSGAVVLAQALGTVPVASALGGIPEQLDGGRSGVLVPPGADVGVWRHALDGLQDEARRTSLAKAGRRRALAAHGRFAAAVRAVVS